MATTPVRRQADPVTLESDEEEAGALGGWSVDDLNTRLGEIKKDPKYQIYLDLKDTAPQYRNEFTAGQRVKGTTVSLIVVAAVIIGIAALVFMLVGAFNGMSLSDYFMNWVQHITFQQGMIALGVTVVLFTGAALVIHRASHKREHLLERRQLKVTLHNEKNGHSATHYCGHISELPVLNDYKIVKIEKTQNVLGKAPKRGAISNLEDHLETVLVKCEGVYEPGETADMYIDTSTLDEAKKNGKAYLYIRKDVGGHYMVSSIVAFFGTPIIFIGMIVYNVIRAVIAPFYILVQWLRERITGETLYPQARQFKLLDVGKAFVQAIWAVVKAPFYAVAFILAGIYSLFNPMGGRKLGAAIERDWNEGLSLSEGFWSVGGGQKLFGNLYSPDRRGAFGYFIAGCWQPTGVAEYKDGKIIDAYWLPKAVIPGLGKPFQIQTRTELVDAYRKQNVKTLIDERDAIVKELEKRGEVE